MGPATSLTFHSCGTSPGAPAQTATPQPRAGAKGTGPDPDALIPVQLEPAQGQDTDPHHVGVLIGNLFFLPQIPAPHRELQTPSPKSVQGGLRCRLLLCPQPRCPGPAPSPHSSRGRVRHLPNGLYCAVPPSPVVLGPLSVGLEQSLRDAQGLRGLPKGLLGL